MARRRNNGAEGSARKTAACGQAGTAFFVVSETNLNHFMASGLLTAGLVRLHQLNQKRK